MNILSAPRSILLLISLLAVPQIVSAQASRDLMARFNKLAQEGDAVHQRDGAQSAIDFYERALLDPDFEDFGRIHMRMALIHQDDRRFPEAAYHFLACMRDDRVDKVDREFICRGGYEEVTAPLLLRDLPERAQVFILEPQLLEPSSHFYVLRFFTMEAMTGIFHPTQREGVKPKPSEVLV